MKDLPFDHVKAALKLYLNYFIAVWLIQITVLFVGLQIFGVKLAEITDAQNRSLSFFTLLFHLILLVVLIFKGNKNFRLITKSSFAVNSNFLIASILLGLGMGRLLPLIANSGYLLPEHHFLHNFTKESIESFANFYHMLSGTEMLLSIVMGTVIFSILRELFFRGLLLPLYRKDFNITRATLQVSVFFVLIYYMNQINQLDFLSLFIFSIFLCFITFKSESLIPAILATIAYDFPFILMILNDAFYLDPYSYMVFNTAHILEYLLYAVAIAVAFYLFNQTEKRKNETL